jgi:hypothetical protein
MRPSSVFLLLSTSSVGILAGLWISAYTVSSHARGDFRESFTSPQPTLVETGGTEEEYQLAKQKVDWFISLLRAKGEQSSLSLSAAEVNSLIGYDPRFREWRGHARVGFTAQVEASVSIPLDRFGYVGRYLNGTILFTPQTDAGRIVGGINQIRVGEQVVPEKIVEELEAENFGDLIPAPYAQDIDHIGLAQGVLTVVSKKAKS